MPWAWATSGCLRRWLWCGQPPGREAPKLLEAQELLEEVAERSELPIQGPETTQPELGWVPAMGLVCPGPQPVHLQVMGRVLEGVGLLGLPLRRALGRESQALAREEHWRLPENWASLE